jgi:hypothetical protein
MSDSACPTCGASVTVVTGGEGTSHYQPQGDRVTVIARWRCEDHGDLDGRKAGPNGVPRCAYRGCTLPVERVEYVPADQLAGAVEAIGTLIEHADVATDDAYLVRRSDVERLRASSTPRGQ